jgi:cell wall-associated NlpC family hydrolase
VRSAVIGVTSLAVAGASMVAVTGSAQADPDLDSVRERVSQVSEQVDALYLQAEEANQRYLAAKQQHRDVKQRLTGAKRAVNVQSRELHEMTSSMGGFAAAAYRQGVIDPTLQLVLSTNPNDALAESTMMDAFADQQSAALATVAAERTRLAAREASVQEQAAMLGELQAQMRAEQKNIDGKVAEAESLLESLQAKERRLLAEIEQQREAAAVAASRDLVRADAPEQQQESFTAPPASGRAGAAVAFAMAQRGDPYVYGGTGPNGWDCSGLTSGAWAAAGVGIPRTSQAQLYGLPRVPVSAVQPGDIIVYYGGASHVGMYIGGGMIVHASRPGTPVAVVPMYSMPVVGAVRPG